ncbi:HK97-gp10 family putative phage morphogenesis protein [Oceanobacillus timonensis]|uniref:HK97-gp10 family putative phage morphogenesis protein n=1 Tax=Oceanobacillus timonensis TaxID=1926285 RepID=UPI0009BB6B40|nr:HK97-gp10 family putative phage morphogenesis protein [Oceanobacillus timonensis]
MDLDGFDDLLKNLDRMHDDIDDDVGEVVKKNTIEMTRQAAKNGQQRFNKGYATGYTVRKLDTNRVNKMHYKTLSPSEHSGFIEWGTRFMEGTMFLGDSFLKQRPQFLSDLERLVE